MNNTNISKDIKKGLQDLQKILEAQIPENSDISGGRNRIQNIYNELISAKLKQKTYTLVNSDISSFLLSWRNINILKDVMEKYDIEVIANFCYGINLMIDTFPANKWRSKFLDKNTECVSGISIMYKHILKSKSSFETITNFPETATMLNNLESLIQNVILLLFREIPHKQMISLNRSLLSAIIESIESEVIETRNTSLYLVKKILKESSLHYSVLGCIEKQASKKELNKLQFLIQYYDSSNKDSKINKILTTIITRIYYSHSVFPNLTSWIEDINASKIIVPISKEEENEENNDYDIHYWKDKYFEIVRETNELERNKWEKEEYEENMKNLEKKNEILNQNLDIMTDELKNEIETIKTLKRASKIMKSITETENFKDKKYFNNLHLRASQFSQFSTDLVETSINGIQSTIDYINMDRTFSNNSAEEQLNEKSKKELPSDEDLHHNEYQSLDETQILSQDERDIWGTTEEDKE